jgi:integrating conjugative element protein (TIGR03759 family)
MKILKITIAAFLLIAALNASAANTQTENKNTNENTNTKIIYSSFQNLSKDQQKQIAKAWQITPKEYQKYLYYINYTPDKTTYDAATTNPLWILAAHTQDKKQYEEYLKKAVIIEHDEVGRMLQVGQDFSKMAKKLYPNEYPVMPPWLITDHLKPGDTVQLFCKINDQTSSNILGKMLPMIRRTFGAKLDIFAVGKFSGKDIVNFGIRNSISKEEVKNKKITLNFGNQAFDLLKSEAGKNLPLPFVAVKRNGKEIPVNITGGNNE